MLITTATITEIFQPEFEITKTLNLNHKPFYEDSRNSLGKQVNLENRTYP